MRDDTPGTREDESETLDGETMTSLQTIGVIGAGTMGSGIAQACAVVGLSVTMVGVDEAAVARGRNAVSSSLDRLVKKEKLSAADKGAALNCIAGTQGYGARATR